MRLTLIVSALVLWCGLDTYVAADEAKSSKSPATGMLEIRPDRDAPWGASHRDVQKVLDSTAQHLWRYFPDRKLKPILVRPKGGPIVLYQRGSKGEFQVRLSTGSTYWAQYAFQFAHEFCHILCRYDEDKHRNGWFEESVCEVASLFALRSMAKTWKKKAPYPNWKGYAKALNEYADDRIAKGRLPDDQTFVQWYRKNSATLQKNATQRAKNNIVAAVLLPLFEKSPEHWEAVGYLNKAKSTDAQSFAGYLEDWRSNCPPRHRPFVEQVAKKFGVDLVK